MTYLTCYAKPRGWHKRSHGLWHKAKNVDLTRCGKEIRASWLYTSVRPNEVEMPVKLRCPRCFAGEDTTP